MPDHLKNPPSTDWRPTASLTQLQRRAAIMATLRQFLTSRGYLEVETPLLCQHTVTDPYIDSFYVPYTITPNSTRQYALQTSPEYAMKRLLAANYGPIYQISKAFRHESAGRWHNPEFTMLEWYRPGYTHNQLIVEVDALLQTVLNTPPACIMTYRALFQEHVAIDPFHTTLDSLLAALTQHSVQLSEPASLTITDALQLLMSHCIEPHLGQTQPCIVVDFPAEQAALAQLAQRDESHTVAERFEVYVKGVELANGFHELTDAKQQHARFEANQAQRQAQEKYVPTIDRYFISALEAGLPQCAGVALGVDRLVMLATGATHIQDVIPFPVERA